MVQKQMNLLEQVSLPEQETNTELKKCMLKSVFTYHVSIRLVDFFIYNMQDTYTIKKNLDKLLEWQNKIVKYHITPHTKIWYWDDDEGVGYDKDAQPQFLGTCQITGKKEMLTRLHFVKIERYIKNR